MLGALAQVVPERVPVAGEGGNTVLSMGGLTPGPAAIAAGSASGASTRC
jgi:hypothetical protein